MPRRKITTSDNQTTASSPEQLCSSAASSPDGAGPAFRTRSKLKKIKCDLKENKIKISEGNETPMHIEFINALKSGNNTIAEELFPKVKDDLSLLDKKYNLVELIYKSLFNYVFTVEWMDKFISARETYSNETKYNSTVSSDILLFGINRCNDRVVRSLLSYGTNPNAEFNSYHKLNIFFTDYRPRNTIIKLICHTDEFCNNYWWGIYDLIIYGLDISIDCKCETCNNNNLFEILRGKLNGYHKSCEFHRNNLNHLIDEIKRGVQDIKVMQGRIKSYDYMIVDLWNIVVDYL